MSVLNKYWTPDYFLLIAGTFTWSKNKHNNPKLKLAISEKIREPVPICQYSKA
jgi:hypothetical protein